MHSVRVINKVVYFVENCNDTYCSYKACVLRVCLQHACLRMGVRDLSCGLASGPLYTKWPLDVRSLGHRDAIVRDSNLGTLCCMIEPALDPD